MQGTLLKLYVNIHLTIIYYSSNVRELYHVTCNQNHNIYV
jgi:hypothetical protein